MIRAASRVSRQHQRVGGRVAVRGLRLSPTLRNQAGVPVTKPPAPPVIKTTTLPPPPVVETTHVHLPPPPPPPKKKFSLFRFLLGTTLLTAVVYGGTLYAASKNDDVMDFIIDKNPPYYEELLDFIETGSIEELQKRFESLTNKVSNLLLPSSDQIDRMKSKFEKTGGDLIKDTKDKLGSVGKTESFNAPDATPEQQLQKPVEIESVKKDVQKLPLIELTKNAEKTLDASVKATIESFNNLIRSIDTSKLDSSTSSSNLVKLVQESVDKLASKVDSLSNNFESELKARLKTSQTELLSSYTAKELELTENFVNQFNNEKGKLEAKLNKRLEQEIQATKEAISQAAVNAVSMVRIEQTKNFEKMVKDKLDQERNGRLANLEQLDQKLNELEKFAESLEAQLTANQTKAQIHNSLTKLKTVLFNSSDPSQAPKLVLPYVEDLAIQTKGSKDEVIQLALNELLRLLAKESSHSILTNSQLLSRWELLAPELRSASLLPPNAGLLGHLTSSLFSKLLFPVKGAKPDGKDIESVIGRVEASLVRGDLDVAIEEAANLKGWPRKLADDWVVEGRKRLEAQFLVDLIDAESRIL